MEKTERDFIAEAERTLARAQAIARRGSGSEQDLTAEYRALSESYSLLVGHVKAIDGAGGSSQAHLFGSGHELEIERKRSTKTLETLIAIGKALSGIKDLDQLLRHILMLCKRTTAADAGSVFLVTQAEGGTRRLLFKYSHTFSKDLPYEQHEIALDRSSIAGYVALTGNVLNIPDAYGLSDDDPISFNASFDNTYGYRTRSMLVVPMKNHWDQVIGVIQLINCKDSELATPPELAYEIALNTPADFEKVVVPFDARYQELMEAVASQAAIALENNRMIQEIEQVFQQFVRASVEEIESRDPATYGHSERVAKMSVALARAVSDSTREPFAAVSFGDDELLELEMACLLHDFGKLYVEPSILMKSKKLHPHEYDYLMLRLRSIQLYLELCACEAAPERERLRERLAELSQIATTIQGLNEPTIMDRDPADIIRSIQERSAGFQCDGPDGEALPLLTPHEIESLRISRGTLNPRERRLIEEHVGHSCAFAGKIPWPEEFSRIPEIIHHHHERIDGSGYPDGVAGVDEIPLQAHILMIADVFDALAASDRSYKKALPLDRVLGVLEEEAANGRMHSDLVALLEESRAYTCCFS